MALGLFLGTVVLSNTVVARDEQLTGSEGGFHDWNYLLSKTGLLGQTKTVANLIRFVGTMIIFCGIIGAFLYSTKDEQTLSDLE